MDVSINGNGNGICTHLGNANRMCIQYEWDPKDVAKRIGKSMGAPARYDAETDTIIVTGAWSVFTEEWLQRLMR